MGSDFGNELVPFMKSSVMKSRTFLQFLKILKILIFFRTLLIVVLFLCSIFAGSLVYLKLPKLNDNTRSDHQENEFSVYI